ncbi:MAG: riboflavin biosynthesis protein RibF [Thermomicrobiales bacterium]
MANTVHWSFREAPSGPHVVSIGTFDGVHHGHRYLLSLAAARATQLELPLLIVTFEPNPAQIIRPDRFRGRLNTPRQKLDHLWASGAGQVVVVPFTDERRQESPENFVADLVAAANPVEVWVGEDFALGHNRSGNVARLSEIGARAGFSIHAVPRREHDGQIVSSSRIREHILAGEPELAHTLLGYPYRISGEVIYGAQVGRTIGFPTANVEPPPLLVPLPDGIYASLATLGETNRPKWAMTYIGTRPALNTGARQIETNIFDFSQDIYGQTLHCDFVQRLRPDANFESVEALIAQLERDELATREVLARHTLQDDDPRKAADT